MGRPKSHGASCGGKISRLYRVWSGMKCRCHSPGSFHYPRYGARGIHVIPGWRTSFSEFETWALANGYSEGLQIDRINNDEGYSPENCRWVTCAENCANRRNSILINGETTATVAQRLGITPQALRYRLRSGMNILSVSTLPKVPNGGMRKHFKRHHGLGKWEESQ